ncbi:MAG: hypothetical protein LUF27_12285 [Lachnospiraceae bacterium]|nr:hypothetical protein [Lachnospiraceae bacterium]
MFTGKQKTINMILIFLILAGATVYFFFYSQSSASIRFSDEEGTVSFSGQNDTSDVFYFSEIVSIELEEEPDYGSAVDGGVVNKKNGYGTWESESLGTYHAYFTTKITSCIVISDAEKTAVFNIDNAETTQSLYEQLVTYWEEQQTD